MLAAHIDLAGGIAADQYHGEAGRHAMFGFDARDFGGDAAAQFGGNDLSIDDAGGHVSVLSSVSWGIAAVILRSIAPSFVGSPSTAICFTRDVVPDSTRTSHFGTPSRLASSSVTARFASPPSAMARTRTFTTERPLAIVSIPSISSRPPRGVTRTA